jgi:leucyl aminopeptidase
MRLNVALQPPWDVDADVLAVTVPTADPWPEHLVEVDRRLGGALAALRDVGAARGSLWSAALLPVHEMGARFVLAVGVGDGDAVDRLGAARLGNVIVKRLAGCDVSTLAIHLPDAFVAASAASQAALVELVTRGLVEGAEDPSTLYREGGDTLPPRLEGLTFVVDSGSAPELTALAERGRVIGEGTNRTRRLAHRSANDVSPEVLADEATDLARAHGLELTILDAADAERLGMGMFLAVGRGSDNPPRFIALRNEPAVERDGRGRLLAMVGKGVTFDSGGISLKPSPNMGEMKSDKTGACTVISAIATAVQLAPELPLLAVAPAVENMPGPHSTRPGDVVRALNGKTVEINNTDAEGRLILGDALTWAEQQGATHLVDVATLTGAMARALGRYMTGGFGSDDAWWEDVATAAARQGEPLWRMPLVDDLRADLDTPFADMSNIGTAEGGAITAALFLREFVTRPWVHLDVAGTAFLRKADAFSTRGSTGVMHATLVELAVGGSGADPGGTADGAGGAGEAGRPE